MLRLLRLKPDGQIVGKRLRKNDAAAVPVEKHRKIAQSVKKARRGFETRSALRESDGKAGFNSSTDGGSVSGSDRIPVHRVPPRRDVVRAFVLIFKIIGVFPDVAAENGCATATAEGFTH